MKTIRVTNKSGVSKLFIPLLGLLLVFSISLHNHKISLNPETSVKITTAAHPSSNSVDFCSACFLSGNIKLTNAVAVFSLTDPGQSISFNEIKLLIPRSFLRYIKPSRSPPVAI
jgi:hypothetical protein